MKVFTIIPAYNEEERIGQVIDSIKGANFVNDIIVVDDGSTDRTRDIVRGKRVPLIELSRNIGKGGAMQKGMEKIKDADLIAFIDADLIGFESHHMDQMIEPFLTDKTLQMAVGKFAGGRTATDLAQKVAPQISGQRVVTKNFLHTFPDLSITRFGVEVAINEHAKKSKAKCKEVILENVSHVMKEEKLGLKRGFIARLKMYNDILKYFFRRQKKQ